MAHTKAKGKKKQTRRRRQTRKQRGGGGDEDNGIKGLAFWLIDNLPKREESSSSTTTDIGLMPYSLTEIRVINEKLLDFLKTKGVKEEELTAIREQFDVVFALPKNQRGGGPDNGGYGPGPNSDALVLYGWMSLSVVMAIYFAVLRRGGRLVLFGQNVHDHFPVIFTALSALIRIANGHPADAHVFTCLAIGSSIANLRIDGRFIVSVYNIRGVLTYLEFLGGAAAPVAQIANIWYRNDLMVKEIPQLHLRYEQLREGLNQLSEGLRERLLELNMFLLAIYVSINILLR